MVEKLPLSASYDDWKAFGPINRSMPNDNEIYDGTTRETPTTPYWAHLYVGGPNKVLGNPNHNYQADGFSNEQSQFFHIMNVLDAGGKEAFKLVREAAKAGDRMTQDAERIGGHPDAWTAIGPDAESAKVVRGLVTTALKHYPPGRGVLSQELPKTPADIDFKAFSADFAEEATPKRFRARVLGSDGKLRVAEKNETLRKGEQRFGGVVAVFADKGLETAAANWMGQQHEKLLFAPSKNADLWKAIISGPKSGHRREKLYDGKANQNAAMDQVIAAADAVTVFWNDDPRSPAAAAIAAAARAGKLAKVRDTFDNEIPLMPAAREAMQANMSKQEYARAQSMDAFSLSTTEPVGRFALSLIHSEKDGRISDKDINRLAMMGDSINNLSALAADENGKETLLREHRISPNAIRLLADEKVMANARSSYLGLNKHFAQHGVEVIGPEDYPQGLLSSRQMPPYLFVQGPKDAFRDSENVVGIIGEAPQSDIGRRLAASRAAPAISALASSSVTIARVEGETSQQVPVNGPQILLISSGHGHDAPEAFEADRQAVLDAGGVIVSHLPPLETGSFYNRKTKDREGMSSRGTQLDVVKSGALLGAISDTVLVTEMNASKTNSPTHAAVLAGIKADRRPVVVNYDDIENLPDVSGNRALLRSTGEKALTRAGYGNSVVQELRDELSGSHLAIDTGSNTSKAMTNLVNHIQGKPLDLPQTRRQRTADEAEL